MEKKNLKKDILILLLSFSAVAILVMFWNILAPFQLDNDNIYLKTVISGEMTGKSEPHMLHMSVISGFLLSILYSVTGNGIPWFGLFLCLSMAFPMILMLNVALKKCSKIYEFVLAVLFFVLVYCTFFYRYFAKTQYTLATGMAGAGALLLFYLISFEKNLKEVVISSVPFWILSLWSFAIRDKAFIMLFPFLGLLIIRKLIVAREKKQIVNISVTVSVFVLIILFAALVNKAAYSSKEWKEYREYNSFREAMVDYNGLPDYEENKDLYDECGITKSSYEAFKNHYNIILDENINRDSMEKLSLASQKINPDAGKSFHKKVTDAVKEVLLRSVIVYDDRPMNFLVIAMYFFVILMLAIQRKYKGLSDTLLVFAAGFADRFYLVWNKRYPFRVTQIIFLAELVLLFAIAVENELYFFSLIRLKKESETKENGIKTTDENSETKKDKNVGKRKINPLFLMMIIVILGISIRFGLPISINEYKQIKGTDEYSVCFDELEKYLDSHKDNFYFFDMSHLYYCEDTLSFKKSPTENYVYMGSWMPNSPWYKHKLENAGIKNAAEGLIEKDNVYIIYQQVDFDTRDFLDYYYSEHFPGSEIRLVDSFTTSNGFVYEILKPEYVN